ncbi:hypothetical protein [Nocardia asteroides]|uniref:hypothetical protein n=1 Tax=Nocardia asteroides TaxID=1824 RepID=UPI001E599093|nr:hypothetical protein [Nocardia asteroides]UGT55184.1 hypothetical protein LTT85_32160 [Nocardia asteroides]
MTEVTVAIVHDELGDIVSVSRLDSPNVVVLAGERQSVFTADVAEEQIENLVGTHRVDTARKALVPH